MVVGSDIPVIILYILFLSIFQHALSLISILQRNPSSTLVSNEALSFGHSPKHHAFEEETQQKTFKSIFLLSERKQCGCREKGIIQT